MPSYFEKVEEEDTIDEIIDRIEWFMDYKHTWMALMTCPPKYPKYTRNDIRTILSKYM